MGAAQVDEDVRPEPGLDRMDGRRAWLARLPRVEDDREHAVDALPRQDLAARFPGSSVEQGHGANGGGHTSMMRLSAGSSIREGHEARRKSTHPVRPGSAYARSVTRVDAHDAPALTFLGGAGTVTGSAFLLDTAGARVLVDCGLYQGRKELRELNWEPFPVDPATIDAVVVTHAHLDHCGALPRLVAQGLGCRVHATPETIGLAAIVLRDSAHLQEEDAERANRRGYTRHHPALPLSTTADAERALRAFVPLALHRPTSIAPGVRVTATRAGHILGAVSLLVELDGPPPRTVVFSGDLGRPAHPLLLPPEPRPAADVVVLESTYGDRTHEDADASEELAAAIRRTAARGGTVVIPAYAVDRTEVVLVHLAALAEAGRIPDLPVLVDSPMALEALRLYRRGAFDPVWMRDDSDVMRALDPGRVTEVRDPEGSKAIDRDPSPKIVVSASGMATGGRVLHHLARFLPDPRSTVVLVGFQAPGTRGSTLEGGAASVRLHGEDVPVRAEIVSIPSFSVHADRDELAAWLVGTPDRPAMTYLVHGEDEAASGLAHHVRALGDWPVHVARRGERVALPGR
jgi:metallo-beta-lactamase family protein